ncbi:hypothetical protein [Photobacterium leiognathi]|uniref:hypothetical protein n=1 Tax=Photobacterium leiognathi TaxID=553611 RepID=UPI00298207C0|nr:hypothetical protein [Photobacterium leiognathi]
METTYITVDLELHGDQPFYTLLSFLNQKYQGTEIYPPDQYHSQWMANISFTDHSSANRCLENHCKWLESMPEDVRKEWNNISHKVMNVGYNTSSSHQAFIEQIKPSVIKQLANLALGFAFTLYPIELED